MLEALQSKQQALARDRIKGRGEMPHLIRAFDWASTPLGPIEQWSDTLLIAVNMMLGTRQPILLLWGPEMVLLYNDGFRPILADRHPQALGTPGREFWIDGWHVFGEQLEAVLREGRNSFSKNALVPILRNGVISDAYFTYSYSPVYDPAGHVAGILTICEDLTATVMAQKTQASAEDALRARQQELDKTVRALNAEHTRLLTIVQQAPAFFALLEGPQHVFTMVNPPYMKLVGNRDVMGKPVAEAIPEVVEQGYIDLLDHVFSSGEPVTGEAARLRIVMHEGQPPEERYVNFVYQPLRGENNTVSGIIAMGIDVTEAKRATRALLQSEKLAAVGRLAASIAHEINNPLGSVTNLVYLARSSSTMAEAQLYLDAAEHELRRMAAITTQTLRFNKHSSKPAEVNCEQMLASILNVYRSRLMNAQAHVETRLRCSTPVLCFEGEIRQVLHNLISNAIDAMQIHGGRLLLRIRGGVNWTTGQPSLVITIADTGIGIAPETARRIFEPFFTTKGTAGTGLGLWVSQEIVARHNGSLRVRSRQRRGASGTVFTVSLPFETVPAAASDHATAPTSLSA